MRDGPLLGAANDLLEPGIPSELVVHDGVPEGDEAGERVRGNRVLGRERAGGVSARALVREHP